MDRHEDMERDTVRSLQRHRNRAADRAVDRAMKHTETMEQVDWYAFVDCWIRFPWKNYELRLIKGLRSFVFFFSESKTKLCRPEKIV